MSDDAALIREIAQLTGSIKNYKQNQAISKYNVRGRGAYRGLNSHRGHRARGGFRGARGSWSSRGSIRGSRGASSTSYQAPAIKYNAPCSDFTATGNVSNCKRWTNLGKCMHGLSCRYQHDPHRVALCKTVLHGKQCTDALCTLNHDMNEHNAPLCTHFARGHCTREDCRFTHMTNMSGTNEICPAFSLEGWCDQGAKCPKLHVFECPEFAQTGKCTRTQCNLQHTLRASHPATTTAPPAPEPKGEINVTLLLDEIDTEDEGESESKADGIEETETVEKDLDSDSSSDESLSSDILDPSDFDDFNIENDNDTADNESFIHI